jgi:hypothetical protein
MSQKENIRDVGPKEMSRNDFGPSGFRWLTLKRIQVRISSSVCSSQGLSRILVEIPDGVGFLRSTKIEETSEQSTRQYS